MHIELGGSKIHHECCKGTQHWNEACPWELSPGMIREARTGQVALRIRQHVHEARRQDDPRRKCLGDEERVSICSEKIAPPANEGDQYAQRTGDKYHANRCSIQMNCGFFVEAAPGARRRTIGSRHGGSVVHCIIVRNKFSEGTFDIDTLNQNQLFNQFVQSQTLTRHLRHRCEVLNLPRASEGSLNKLCRKLLDENGNPELLSYIRCKTHMRTVLETHKL